MRRGTSCNFVSFVVDEFRFHHRVASVDSGKSAILFLLYVLSLLFRRRLLLHVPAVVWVGILRAFFPTHPMKRVGFLFHRTI